MGDEKTGVIGRMRRRLTPPWLTWTLMYLGAVYVVFYPLSHSLTLYGLMIALAVVFALWSRSRSSVTVLERSETDTERVVLLRMTWKKRSLRSRKR